MTRIRGSVAAAVCICVLFQGTWAQCGGWQLQAEARRACCENGCAGHEHGVPPTGLGQAGADRCCASSEPDGSSPATPFTLGGLSPAQGPPAVVSVLALTRVPLYDRDFGAPSLLAATVPRHLFLSVFLI